VKPCCPVRRKVQCSDSKPPFVQPLGLRLHRYFPRRCLPFWVFLTPQHVKVVCCCPFKRSPPFFFFSLLLFPMFLTCVFPAWSVCLFFFPPPSVVGPCKSYSLFWSQRRTPSSAPVVVLALFFFSSFVFFPLSPPC